MQVYSRLIDPKDAEQKKSQQRLLAEAGIRLDPLIDWSIALYEEDEMLATASCFRYTLRSIAVSPERRGIGLMAQLITAVEKEAAKRGLKRLLLISQPTDRKLFSAVGFTKLVSNSRGVSLMENSASHFQDFLEKLEADLDQLPGVEVGKPRRAAIVMNANPFTKGHRYLVETALKESDQLLVLVLSDDPEEGFTFEQRFAMVRRGCADLARVLVAPSGPYAVSTASFPSYFYPPREVDESSLQLNDEAGLDAALFARIAEYLEIGKRFVGSEPTSGITNFYNQVLSRELSAFSIELRIIERLTQNGAAVSASHLREFLKDKDAAKARAIVPATTWDYLLAHQYFDTESGNGK